MGALKYKYPIEALKKLLQESEDLSTCQHSVMSDMNVLIAIKNIINEPGDLRLFCKFIEMYNATQIPYNRNH
jgi:hypothetical protein